MQIFRVRVVRSVTADCVLPGVEQLVIILLLASDAALVLDLCKFRSTFLIHAVLQVTAHSAVSLGHLTQHISLVSLLVEGLLERSLFVCTVLAINLVIDLRLIVLFMPLSLFFECLLEEDVLLSILIDILEQVDAGLVLTTPLLFTSIPLLLVLFLGQGFEHALLSGLITLLVLVVTLKFLDFVAAGKSLLSLEIFNSSLTLQGG